MTKGLKERLATGWDVYPTVMDYTELLDIVQKKLKIKDRDVARERYGNKTYAQWRGVLK